MRHVILGLALVFVIAGCSGGPNDGESAETATTSDSTSWSFDSSDPEFPLVYPGPPTTAALLTEGILHIDPDLRCVTLEGPDEVQVAAVPEETTIDLSDEASPALVLEGCRPMHDGELIQFVGFGSAADEEILEQYVSSAFLERCEATTERLVLIGHCASTDRR